MPCRPSPSGASALAFSGDGTILAVAGGVPGTSGKVVLLDWKAGAVLGEIGGFTDVVTAVAFGPDGTVAAASADRSAALFTLHDNGKRSVRAAEFVGHAGPVLDVDFSPDGRSVVTASADRSIKVWEKGGKLLRTLTHHTDIVQCLAIRPAAAARPDATDVPPWACASGGDDKTVRVWQPGIGRMVRIVRRHEGSVLALAYAPDGKRLFSAGADGFIRAIDADSDQIHLRGQGPSRLGLRAGRQPRREVAGERRLGRPRQALVGRRTRPQVRVVTSLRACLRWPDGGFSRRVSAFPNTCSDLADDARAGAERLRLDAHLVQHPDEQVRQQRVVLAVERDVALRA